MHVYRGFDDVPFDAASAVTIGTFDGVHRGHRHIIDDLLANARRIGGRSVVVTFHPHPQVVLRRKGDSVPILTTIEERTVLLASLGVDVIVVLPFTTETAATPWRVFAEDLVERVGVAHIVFGHDHAFGRGREGTAAAMRLLGKEEGFTVSEVPPFEVDGEVVSSTKIRHALTAGDLTAAEHYLGRPYAVIGDVIRGDGRGRTLGIPTANIRPTEPEKLLPGDGVYCVSLTVDGGTHRGMANIGLRPTFTEAHVRTLEVHIFGFDRDIYDNRVTAEFRRFVRSEQKFASKEAFLAQLQRDREVCGGAGREASGA